MSYEDLLKKWEPILEHPEFAEIKDPYKKKVTAILLENQDRDMEEAKNGGYGSLRETNFVGSDGYQQPSADGGNTAGFDPVLISMIRRSMPNLIAFDIMGVQPMNGPSGLIFAMRSQYVHSDKSRTEALFDEADTNFSGNPTAAKPTNPNGAGNPDFGDLPTDASNDLTAGSFRDAYLAGGGMGTDVAEKLGGDSGHFAEMAMSIEKVAVVAKSRALKAEYTMELAQDLKAIHNLDAESELANILSTEIMAEINREMIRKINMSAKTGGIDTNAPGVFDLDVDSSGRWSVEKFKGLMFQIEREANAIAKDTRRGKGNVILCSADVASALQMAGVLDYNPAIQQNLKVDDTGSTFAGVLSGKYKVYIDPYVASDFNYVTLGYRGSNPYDAGLFYCPYVPLQMVRALGENTFQPKIGFKTRYGLVANPFATRTSYDENTGRLRGQVGIADGQNTYYRALRVDNLL